MSQVTITVDVTPVISYAMAHTRISPVRSVEITNAGPARQGAQLTIEVRDGQGVLSKPWTRALDLAADAAVVLSDIPLALAPDAMEQVEEARPGSITFVMTHGDEMLGACEQQVDVLAGHQWLAVPPGLAEELLATHVMPNAPQITALMPRVAELVGRKTGRATLDGYQSEDPSRTDALAASVFEALQERGVHYAEPPASWADVGQKIRTPAEVIDGRLGTCLDTAVVLAAALEQAGVRPQIWLLTNHALLGYWRAEMNPPAVTYDVSELMNYVDLGVLALVETTLVTAADTDFAEAAASGARTVRSDMTAVVRVLDVYAARRNHILPLPAVTRDGGVVQVVEYRPAVHSVAPGERTPTTPAASAGEATSSPMPARVQQWKNALLDLSLRNRLINFNPRNAVALHTAPVTVHALEDDLANHRHVVLRPADDIPDAVKAQFGRTAADLPEPYRAELYASHRAVFTDIGSDAYLARLRSLAYKARTIQEETGANNLYLALGSLVWELDGRPLRSPLVLVPLVMKAGRGGALYQVTGDEAGQSTPNYCLLERLRQSFGLDVPGLENPISDGSGIDLAAAFAALREALALNGLPFHVEETAAISVLQFAKYRLWKDIDDSWEQLLQAPLVRHLALTPTEEFVDPVGAIAQPDLEDLATRCPIPADGSQLTAIAEALAGRSFVLEGPPGTGKSQTIANLLSRAIAEGKKVLFVAEKRAALDVVSRRINAVGLGDFTLDLHDKLSKPAAVRRQIARALDYDQRGDQQGVRAQMDIAQSAGGVLDRYATRLHEPNAAHLSLYSARTQHLALGDGDGPGGMLPVPEHVVQSADSAAIEELRATMRRLPEVADPAAPSPDAPWLFVQADAAHAVDVTAVAALARRIDALGRLLRPDTPTGRVARRVGHPEEAAALARIATTRPPLWLLDEVRHDRWRAATSDLRRQVEQFRASAAALAPATPAILDLPLPELLDEARTAAASFFIGRGKRQQAVLAKLAPGLGPSAPHRKELIAHLERWAAMKTEAARLLAVANGIPGVRLPEGWNPLTEDGRQALDTLIPALEHMARAVAPGPNATPFGTALRAYVESSSAAEPEESAAVEDLRQAMAALPPSTGATADALARWAGEHGFLPRWEATSARRQTDDPELRSLSRWLSLRAHLVPLARHGLHEAHAMILTGRLASDDAVLALERGLAAASLTERRRSVGLDAFDPAAHQRTVTRFVDASARVRSMLPAVLPMGAVARRTFAHDATSGQVGRLKRELTRTRGGLSVRELMRQYGDLITEIMPCVLVSPDSVARFLPVGSQVFDVVVFDEASQIRVADAVGAIGRGRSVVVVGDSKQMPPTSFAEVNWRSDQDEDDDVDEVVEDEESILSECVQARLRRQWLTWHYRSQDESLIAFSNAHYYEGKLSSFPSPVVHSADRSIAGHGINLVQVRGEFLRSGGGRLKRTNPVEARAVVEEIKRRFAAAPPGTVPSIGVVTFNQPQRAYIEALLRDSSDDRIVQALESPGANGLFVKNLENVQGDERDVILFSTAFGVNERGVLPLNFGPLNRSGGERRLNVAITRARRQVILFSSFDPAQLRAEETSSVGIKHLRAYLDVAASGTRALERTVPRALNTDRHRDDVAEALRARGLVVTVDVGLSDFRVDLQLALPDDPGQPLAAVLLDGVLWANRLTVSDRDAMPADILKDAMRWPVVERVWLPEWLAGPDGVLDRLERAIREVRRIDAGQDVAPLDSEDDAEASDHDDLPDPAGVPGGQGEPEPVRPAPVRAAPRRALPSEPEWEDAPVLRSAVTPDIAPPVTPDTAPQVTPDFAPPVATLGRPFVPWPAPAAGAVDVLDGLPHHGPSRIRVGAALRDAIEAEGPVHQERLAKLVAGAFGLQRVAAFRAEAILAVVSGRADSGGFFWPVGVDPRTWLGYRPDPDARRPIGHVSEVEIANAMREQCADAHAMAEEELFAETLRVFGYRRRTPALVTRMRQAVDVGLYLRRLEQSSDGLYRSVGA